MLSSRQTAHHFRNARIEVLAVVREDLEHVLRLPDFMRNEDVSKVGFANVLVVVAEELLRLVAHEVGGDELCATEEHGDPEQEDDLQLPPAEVPHLHHHVRDDLMDLVAG